MTFKPLRPHTAIAIDGGGIKGLIVAKALAALEKELGGKPLIEHPEIKVLAGTSTGAILAAGVAIGLPMSEVVRLYIELGETIFPRVNWLPKSISDLVETLKKLIWPSLFDNHALRRALEQQIGSLTLGDLHERLNGDRDYQRRPNERVIIFTTVDVAERRTRFLKSNDPKEAHIPVVDAVMASGAAPSFLPVVKLRIREGEAYKTIECTDGGVGSFGNPAYVAAREIIDWLHNDPKDVSILSFGTGFVTADQYLQEQKPPSVWRLIKWAANIPIIMIGDAARAQSIDILAAYQSVPFSQVFVGAVQPVQHKHFDYWCNEIDPGDPDQLLDFRRYQLRLKKDIGLDDARPRTIAALNALGDQMAANLVNNRVAPSPDVELDPEGLYHALKRFARSQRRE